MSLSRLVSHTYDADTGVHEATYELGYMPGRDIGIYVCEKFGVDPRTVRALTLRLDVNAIPVMTVEHPDGTVTAHTQEIT